MTMLDRMRRHKSWLKWSLAIVVLTFVLLYIPDFVQTTPTGTGAGAREVVAEINGRTVTAGDFQQRYVSQVAAYRQQFGGSLNDQLMRQLGIDQQILSQMIDEQVGLIEAEQNGITVSDDELAQQIFSIPALQENGRFIGEQRYEQLLQSQNPPMTKSQFEDTLRRSMVLDKLRAALTDWMAVSDGDVQTEYKQRNEKVKLQVVAFTATKFRSGVNVSDADIATHFEAHKAEYRIGEQRKIKYLLLDRDQARLKIAVPPSDIQRYYNDNIQQYQTPEQVKASHILLKTDGKDEAAVRKEAEGILAQVKAGGDFAALAKKYSEDEGSKANGGDLDYFGRGRMVPEFENAAFTMQPGQISDLVKSQFGFHIIKVIDKRPASTTPLEQVRNQITEQLSLQLADQRITDQASQFASRIKDMADLEPAARELQLTVQESGYFQREDPVPGLGAAPQVAAAAFTLQGTAASQPLGTTRGPVIHRGLGAQGPVRADARRGQGARARRLDQGESHGSEQGARNCGCRRAQVSEGLRCRCKGAGSRGQGHRARSARHRDSRHRREPRGRSHRVFAANRIGERSDSDRRRHGHRPRGQSRRGDAGRAEAGAGGVPGGPAQRAPRAILLRVYGQGEGEDEGRDQYRRHSSGAGGLSTLAGWRLVG